MPATKKRKTMTMTKEVAALKRKVRDLETAPELKAKPFTWSAGQLTASQAPNKEYYFEGSVKLINAFTEGAAGTDGERIGSQVTNKSMWIRHKETMGGQSVAYRTAVVWDKQPNGAVASFTDIFFDDVIVGSDLPYTGINLKNRERFQILYDNINSMHKNAKMQLSVALPSGNEIVRDCGESYVDLKNKKSTWAEDGTIPITGALLLATICVNTTLAAGAGGEPEITVSGADVIAQGVIRLRYTDS